MGSLYAITDLGYVEPDQAVAASQALLDGGASILQLRAKGHPGSLVESLGAQILPIARAAGIPFIINDYPEIAGRLAADGFHLGQDDGDRFDAIARYTSALPAETTRTPIVGRSTHSLNQAIAAHAEGFDYIGFGPLFTTPTKPGRPAIGLEEIAAVHEQLPQNFPIYCIGGIKPTNLPLIQSHGTQNAVIVSALLQAKDITTATQAVVTQLSPPASF